MPDCIIFDLDGTLVDSEPLCAQAIVDLLPELEFTVAELVHRFRGRQLTVNFQEIETWIGRALPDDFTQRYRARMTVLFEEQLQPFPGVHDALAALSLPVCIASSGPPEKIATALRKTGLAPFFEDRIFSSYVLGTWKPDPGLFLHAAETMGATPERCLVVEDSDSGVRAARAAGMHVIRFGEHPIAEADAVTFTDYRAFAGLLADPRFAGRPVSADA